MNIIDGAINGSELSVAIIVARFNEIVTDSLAKGALGCLEKHGVSDDNITVVDVPGAFEIAGVAKKLAATGKIDAVVCLGAVIRGETPHFEQVVSGSTAGMVSAGLDTGVPVINGILTCDTVEQAMNRAGLKAGNKGWDAAVVAIEMANLYKKL
jgi:6,7-dimethyl-8-ribityllumazine synthase